MATLARQTSVAFMFQTSGSQAEEKPHGIGLFCGVLCVQAYTKLHSTHLSLLLPSKLNIYYGMK